MSEIKKVVLTGGPCSGKTSALAHIKSHFEDKGVSVLFVPEAATTILSGIGAGFGESKLDSNSFQESIISIQVNLEKIVENIAKQYKGKVLIVLDRGILDSKAYMEDKRELDGILLEHGLKEENILSERYDGIIHMVTAADGAEKFYTLENNSARSESPEQAKELDKKLQKAYVGVTKLSIIDNSTSFEDKLNRVEKQIYSILGIPEPIKKENKYLVEIKDLEKLLQIARKVNIEQTYLTEKGVENEERIRSRAVDNTNPTYFHTIIKEFGDDHIKTERIITIREYLEFKGKGIDTIKKIRYCFLYEGQYFELDVFENNSNFSGQNALLEIKLTEDNDKIILPDFLELLRDVTKDKNFKNRELA